MWVKICGITSAGDAVAAAQAGADAIGLNFVGGPRRISADSAQQILEPLPSFVTAVALVTLEKGRPDETLYAWLIASRIRHLQVYGADSPEPLEWLAQDGFSVFPVVRVQGPDLCSEETDRIVRAGSSVVLDAFDPEQWGGTGKPFSWEWIARAREAGRLDEWPPLILAGGLKADNLAEAIHTAQPDGVDVSSGVELEGRPGVKDSAKIARFIAAARAAGE